MTQGDIFNVGSELRAADGTVYTLKKLTQYQQGEFSRWLEQRAHDAIDRGPESEARKDRRHDRAYADAAIGKYEWDGPLALEAMWTPTGLARILLIVCGDQGVTEAKAEDIVRGHLKEVAAKILVQAASDPKARRELATMLGSLGLPMDWMVSAESDLFSDNSPTRPGTPDSTTSPPSPTTNSSSFTTSSAAPTG